MIAFASHNYIRKNSQDDMLSTILEQYPNYIPHDEFQDIHGSVIDNVNLRDTSSKTKENCNNLLLYLGARQEV